MSELGGQSSALGGTGGKSEDSPAGAAGDDSLGGAGGDTSAAGAAENPAVSARPRSGRKFCVYDDDCEEDLTCTASLGRVQNACLAPCSSNADCKLEEECFSQISIPTSCFQRCTDPTQCEYQYDCADYYGTGDYLCLPMDWVRYWGPPKK